MDKIINKNIDQREKLDESVKIDLDSYYQGIDFKQLLKDPQAYLKEFSMQFLDVVLAEYAERYINSGLSFGREADKEIIEYRTKRDLSKENEVFASD